MSCASDAIFSILQVLAMRGLSGSIIVPCNSFPAVASAVLSANFRLILCDVEMSTGQLKLSHFQQLLESNPDCKAVFVTHYGNSAVDINALRSISPKIFNTRIVRVHLVPYVHQACLLEIILILVVGRLMP